MKAENKSIILGLLIFSTLLLNTQTTTAQCHLDDWTALKALYESTNGDNWTYNTNWQEVFGNLPTANCNLENLYGVELDAQGRVAALLLIFNELIGSIPPELGNLSNLTNLNLVGNELIGSIPKELGNLSNLQDLILYFNQLSGSIPLELGNLSNLKILNLYNNELIGSIPFELGNLSNLTNLSLHTNQLSGNIPSQLGNLSNLKELWLSTNEFTGSIPHQLGNLSNLTNLYLNNNQLIGSIPPELGNLSNLTNLCLRTNQLSGNIPLKLGNLSNLTRLQLSTNQLIGSIPLELGNLSNLNLLRINDNNLSGCYSNHLSILCTQLNDPWFDGDYDISDGNNFEATWENFCATEAGLCVDSDAYPGDLNNDGVVNNQDISLSGFFHTATGSARTTEHQNINWYPHPSEDWGVFNNQGVDLKHHDCNGDGVIDENDQQAIYENMDSIWKIPDPPPPSPSETDYQVMLHPIDQIYDGYLVMNVALERRTSGDLTLQGGHFTIDYSDVEGEFSFVELDFLPITWLGVPTQNLWFETTHFPEDKKIEVGFTKNNDTNSTGSGVIAQLILQYISLARQVGASDISYQFTVNTIGVHNNNGDFTPIEDQQLEIIIDSDICYSNLIIDEEAPFQNLYKSTNTITTNDFVIIGANQKVEFNANRVQINAGFSAKAGADFKVRSSGCN